MALGKRDDDVLSVSEALLVIEGTMECGLAFQVAMFGRMLMHRRGECGRIAPEA